MSRFPRISSPWLTFVAAFALACSLIAVKVAHAAFQDNCNTAAPSQTAILTRDNAQAYSYAATWEGYQWGGGCWNNNDVDEGRGDPPQTVSTRGEGGDCSGLTFKTWREGLSTSDGGRYYWAPLRNVHGPYTAASFQAGSGAPNTTVAKASAAVMDAFASGSHIGMVFYPVSSGADSIVEAKCEACGTDLWTRTYRSESAYGGVRRVGWTG